MKAALIVATLLAALPLSSWSQSKPLPQPPALPAELSQAEISKGMARIKPKIDACAAKSQHQGTVTVSVKVMGSGAVDEVKVKSTPDGSLGACVGAAVQKAAFARTQKGGTFSYPFRFKGRLADIGVTSPPADVKTDRIEWKPVGAFKVDGKRLYIDDSLMIS